MTQPAAGILPEPPGGLWSRPVLAVARLTTAGGAALFVAGWWGVTGAPRLSAQLPWLALSLGGVAVAGAGEAFALASGRRAVGLLRRTVLPAGRPPLAAVRLAAGEARLAAVPRPAAFVTVPGARRFHRPGCLLVAGKEVVEVGGPNPVHPDRCDVCEP